MAEYSEDWSLHERVLKPARPAFCSALTPLLVSQAFGDARYKWPLGMQEKLAAAFHVRDTHDECTELCADSLSFRSLDLFAAGRRTIRPLPMCVGRANSWHLCLHSSSTGHCHP